MGRFSRKLWSRKATNLRRVISLLGAGSRAFGRNRWSAPCLSEDDRGLARGSLKSASEDDRELAHRKPKKLSEDEQGFAGDWTKTNSEDERELAHGKPLKPSEDDHGLPANGQRHS